jgi:hypothetical protein
MSKFRKKPIVIEAWQWKPCKPSDYSPTTWPEWLSAARTRLRFCDKLEIDTPEGWIIASSGDWIIRGVKGELYPCKPDIFAETYEPVP